MEYEYVDDPYGERNCTQRWDHQFEKAISVNGIIFCEACYLGTRTPEIPVPKPGEPMPTAPPSVPVEAPEDSAPPTDPIPAPVPEEPETEPIQSDPTDPVEPEEPVVQD